jgi:4'-phosphopantetheinyl transferase
VKSVASDVWPLAFPEPGGLPIGRAWCWRIVVDRENAGLERRLTGLLDDREQGLAARFAYAGDRHLYVAAHAGLRLVLAAMLGCRPAGVRLLRGPAGRPLVEAGGDIQFSLSHCRDVALIAFSHRVPVGVDVERVRPLADWKQIAARYLHPGERMELMALSEEERLTAFFRCWTRKEAVAKALGLGLSLPLNRYQVSCRPDAHPALLAMHSVGPPPALWSLQELTPMPRYIAALAMPGQVASIVCRTLAWPAWLLARSAQPNRTLPLCS